MASESDIPQTADSGIRVDGIGCLAIVGMILSGTIFLAPLGILIIAISLMLLIISFLRDKLRTRAAGPCPACATVLTWKHPGNACQCHACGAALRIAGRSFVLATGASVPGDLI
jgi:hypothetical protein